MLETGQKYHRDGVIYEVKKFIIDGSKLKIDLLNTSNNQPLNLKTSITNFVSSYSLVPKHMELIRQSPS